MSTEPSPVVSVLVTTHNGASELPAAIESTLNQTFKDFELLVIDDGSTDETPEILDRYDDPRLRVIRQDNRGRGPALQRGLETAKGRYVAILDDDDLMHPHRLERQVAVLEASPSVAAVGSHYTVHWVDTDERVRFRPPVEDRAIKRQLPQTNPLAHSSVTLRRADAVAVGGYEATLQSCIDYDLWIRLAVDGYQLRTVPEDLCTLKKSQTLSSFAFSGRDRLRYFRTMFSIRLQAVRGLDVPVWYYAYPLLMLLLGLGRTVKRQIERRR